jgi:hypothetical protein
MNFRVYKKLYKKLRFENVESLVSEYNLPKDILLSILTQKIIRSTSSRYYRIKARSSIILQEWLSGKSFCTLAKELDFPPIPTASLILQQYGVSKKRFWKYLNNLKLVADERIREELLEARKKDFVYSPSALHEQQKKGREVENFINNWLTTKGLKFECQKALKKKYRKTPDFLLSSPLKVNNLHINWIECKASFGDHIELRRDSKKQFLPYRKLFGSGMAVYWLGYLDNLRSFRKIIIKDKSFFTQCKN